ncbi:TPA: cupin domain-containing protein [Enterobacter hormaechei subsp. steigerwaltii]|nr:cupin domain-containing protein [Enterobacter hormaechei subsp. steigerwaltii]
MEKHNNEIMFGDVTIKILSNSDELTVSEPYLPASSAASVHHRPHEEVNYVISGVLDISCNGEVITLRAGDSMRIPRMRHTILPVLLSQRGGLSASGRHHVRISSRNYRPHSIRWGHDAVCHSRVVNSRRIHNCES